MGAPPGVSPGLVPQPGVFQSPRGQPLLNLLKLRGVLANGVLRGLPVRDLKSSTTHLDPYSSGLVYSPLEVVEAPYHRPVEPPRAARCQFPSIPRNPRNPRNFFTLFDNF